MNVVPCQFSTNRIRETRQRKLASAVRPEMRHSNFAANGGNVHDASPTPETHLWNDLRDQFVRCPKMQLHGALVVFAGHMIERTDLDDAGVVDQDVNSFEVIDDFPDNRVNLSAIE